MHFTAILKTALPAGLLALLLVSCSSKSYTYKINLVKPVASENLSYENDSFAVSFNFKTKYIEFEMYNKLEDGIRVNWDEISISENGEAKRVVHFQTGTDKITETQPPITIPPKSKLIDAFIATNKVFYTRVGNTRVAAIGDTYPKNDYGNKKVKAKIMALKGQKIVVFFPYYLRNVYYSKTFEFLISDIIGK